MKKFFLTTLFLTLFIFSCEEENPDINNSGNGFCLKLIVNPEEGGNAISSLTIGGILSGYCNYAKGSELILEAIPNDGYVFDKWSGDATGSNSKIQIKLDKDKTIYANFLKDNNIDSDGDGVNDDEDFWPYDPSMSEDLWGKIIDKKPEVFFASDISQKVRDGFMSDLNLIIEQLGNYGPLEWWVLGQDIDAAHELAEIYCKRRVERRQETFSPGFDYESCLVKMMYPNHKVSDEHIPSWLVNDPNFKGDFENYRSVVPPSGNAGLNGARHWGIHLLSASFPYSYDENQFGFTKENYTPTVIHEYLHVVQSANLYTTETFVDEVNNTRRVGWGPTSIAEGAASFVNEYIFHNWIKEGKYITSDGFSYNSNRLKNLMRHRMNSIQDMLVNCPNFKMEDLNYGNICNPYTFGAWGVAYLLHKINDYNAMQEKFWPSINQLGYNKAFEVTFGITFEKFNEEFKEFLKLPIDEQLKIIPLI
tara:strand:- start:349 stop:1779 length:1431 start_codon:yes stop_codon:yes gene_type:complete